MRIRLRRQRQIGGNDSRREWFDVLNSAKKAESVNKKRVQISRMVERGEPLRSPMQKLTSSSDARSVTMRPPFGTTWAKSPSLKVLLLSLPS